MVWRPLFWQLLGQVHQHAADKQLLRVGEQMHGGSIRGGFKWIMTKNRAVESQLADFAGPKELARVVKYRMGAVSDVDGVNRRGKIWQVEDERLPLADGEDAA